MKGRRLRLHVLCEDALHKSFIARLADRWDIGPRQRTIRASPHARGSAAQFVLDNFVEVVRLWRAESHDANVGLLVVIDGDEHGLERRRRELAQKLVVAGESSLDPADGRVAVLVPCWHIETWIAWLCGHRPIDERTRYKASDEHGRGIGRKIESGEYSTRQAASRWLPPTSDEPQHVPALAAARVELRRLGVPA